YWGGGVGFLNGRTERTQEALFGGMGGQTQHEISVRADLNGERLIERARLPDEAELRHAALRVEPHLNAGRGVGFPVVECLVVWTTQEFVNLGAGITE